MAEILNLVPRQQCADGVQAVPFIGTDARSPSRVLKAALLGYELVKRQVPQPIHQPGHWPSVRSSQDDSLLDNVGCTLFASHRISSKC
jgi:hypothetical protein